MNNEFYVILDSHGSIKFKADTFTECFNHLLDQDNDNFTELLLDKGFISMKISKIRKRPFKVLREVDITVHDEFKRKEVFNNVSTKDDTCDDLFKEW